MTQSAPVPRTSTGRALARAVPIAALAAATLAAGPARATSGFPSQIRANLDAPVVMGCGLCHATAAGGGPVTTVFGRSMVARGLRAGDDAALATALRALEAEGTDSDGDGVGDVEELRQGLDPNFAGDAGGEPPAFGCGARVAPHAPAFSLTAVVLLGLGIAVFARRRRAR